MLSTNFLKVVILMMTVIGSLGYQYTVPGEMGKSKGETRKNIFEICFVYCTVNFRKMRRIFLFSFYELEVLGFSQITKDFASTAILIH